MDRFCKKCLSKVNPTKIRPLQNPLWRRNELSDWWDCPTCQQVHIGNTMKSDKMRNKKINKLL